jgi:hypothetical protein
MVFKLILPLSNADSPDWDKHSNFHKLECRDAQTIIQRGFLGYFIKQSIIESW